MQPMLGVGTFALWNASSHSPINNAVASILYNDIKLLLWLNIFEDALIKHLYIDSHLISDDFPTPYQFLLYRHWTVAVEDFPSETPLRNIFSYQSFLNTKWGSLQMENWYQYLLWIQLADSCVCITGTRSNLDASVDNSILPVDINAYRHMVPIIWGGPWCVFRTLPNIGVDASIHFVMWILLPCLHTVPSYEGLGGTLVCFENTSKQGQGVHSAFGKTVLYQSNINSLHTYSSAWHCRTWSGEYVIMMRIN